MKDWLNSVELLNKIKELGGRPLLVGGFVRDHLMGLPSKDIDIEVYGLSQSKLNEAFGESIGASFGVWKVGDFDISLPRRERKTGAGHSSFEVESDPFMSPEEALSRRDLTINAIAKDPFSGELIDPFGGVTDIQEGILRHCSDRFREDPLRVLRIFGFSSRFDFDVDPETVSLCRELRGEFSSLSKDRIWTEWKKWGEKSIKPSKGLYFLRDSGWLEFFPLLEALAGCAEDAQWHPQGSAFVHTAHVCDWASFIARRDELDPERRLTLLMAALCHDIAKPNTTSLNELGRIVSPGHAEVGIDITDKFFRESFLGFKESLLEEVKELVGLHMAHLGDLTPRFIRRFCHLKLKKTSIEQLSRLMEADHSGRPPLPTGLPDKARQLKRLVQHFLANQKPEPLILGRDLINRGWEPGPEMGTELRRLYSLQIEDGLGRMDLLKEIK